MSQSRFWVSSHSTYELAATAKKNALNDNPEGVYQIRRGQEKAKEVFRLVQRLKINEVKAVVNSRTKIKKRKRKDADLSWVRG